MKELRHEFANLSSFLFRPDMFVLNHRDNHSRKIIVRRREPYIIDFQEARMGLPHYDAVSLLRDSYVVLQPELFAILKEYYYHKAREAGIVRGGRT